MTDLAVILEKNFRSRPVMGTYVRPEAPLPDILVGTEYLRTKRLASTETKPLYANEGTDFFEPATTPVTTWYVENSTTVFEVNNRGSFESAGAGLINFDDQFGELLSVPGVNYITNSIDATYFFVFDPGVQPPDGSQYRLADFNGNCQIGLVGNPPGNSRITFNHWREGGPNTSPSRRFFATPLVPEFHTSRFDVIVQIKPFSVVIYVNGTEYVNLATSNDYLTSTAVTDTFAAYVVSPLFSARWLGGNQPSVADIQSTLVPLI